MTINTDETVDFDMKKRDFVRRLESMKLKSLAISLYNWEENQLEDNGVTASLLGDIVPMLGDAFEELIFFSDPRCYNYTGRESTSQPFSDLVNFRELSGEVLEVDDSMSRLIEGFIALDAYYSPPLELA